MQLPSVEYVFGCFECICSLIQADWRPAEASLYGDLPELVEQVKESLTIDKSIAGNICTMKIQYNLAQLFDKVMQKANVCDNQIIF